jgi:DNA-binding beta-propeller fold protein YncE
MATAVVTMLAALSVDAVSRPGLAHGQSIPPDTVTTVFVSDTIADFGAVGGVAVDALGFVYVADFQNAVWRISPDGRVSKFADGLYGASGNAIGPRGHLFQSSFHGNYVSRISRDGVVETWVDQGLDGPVGIAAHPDGDLFVVNCRGGSVSRIAPDRTVTEFARHDLMACPNGITFDDRGDLYVVNFNNSKVLRITPDGATSEFTDVVGGGGNGHITFTRGAFYVTKLRGNQIFRLQRDGTYQVLAGTGVAGIRDGSALDATFTRPNGIAASPTGSELWVNDLTEGQGLGQGVSVVSMRRIRVVSLGDVLAAVAPESGVEGVRVAYAAYHESRAGENSSAGAVALGYQWLTAGRIGEALALFEMNAEKFASDPNAQFHFGESYRYTGQPERAAQQYRKALALDPGHTNASARLAEVTGHD